MEKVKKFKEADEIFEIINPYEERGRQEGIEIGVSRGREKNMLNSIEDVKISLCN